MGAERAEREEKLSELKGKWVIYHGSIPEYRGHYMRVEGFSHYSGSLGEGRGWMLTFGPKLGHYLINVSDRSFTVLPGNAKYTYYSGLE